MKSKKNMLLFYEILTNISENSAKYQLHYISIGYLITYIVVNIKMILKFFEMFCVASSCSTCLIF